jgi:hypothetical protein
VFKDHLLNYSIEAAQAWGLEFWDQQPEGALEAAAEHDSTELARVGDMTKLVESRQALQAHNRLSPERVDRVTERVMRERIGIYNSLESVHWQQLERDVETLREFGRVGVPILTAPDFVPSTRDDREPHAWAKNYAWAPAAVDALVYKARLAVCGLFLTPLVAGSIEGRHEISLRAHQGNPTGEYPPTSHWRPVSI